MEAITELLDLCQVCNLQPRLYKCPRCSLASCSLACCKSHKKLNNCDGKRDVTKFIRMKEFGEKSMRNDYHFLENVLQTKQSAKRLYGNIEGDDEKLNIKYNNSIQDTVTTSHTSQNLNEYSTTIKNLVKVAQNKNINLLLMPNKMSKRLWNSTALVKGCIHWKIHLVFITKPIINPSQLLCAELHPESNKTINITSNVKRVNRNYLGSHNTVDGMIGINIENVLESETVINLIRKCFEQNPDDSFEIRYALKPLRKRCTIETNSDSKNNYEKYLRGLIQHIPSPNNKPEFYELILDSTIGEALKGKTIIEYPSLYIGHVDDVLSLKSLIQTLPTKAEHEIHQTKTENNSEDLGE